MTTALQPATVCLWNGPIGVFTYSSNPFAVTLGGGDVVAGDEQPVGEAGDVAAGPVHLGGGVGRRLLDLTLQRRRLMDTQMRRTSEFVEQQDDKTPLSSFLLDKVALLMEVFSPEKQKL